MEPSRVIWRGSSEGRGVLFWIYISSACPMASEHEFIVPPFCIFGVGQRIPLSWRMMLSGSTSARSASEIMRLTASVNDAEQPPDLPIVENTSHSPLSSSLMVTYRFPHAVLILIVLPMVWVGRLRGALISSSSFTFVLSATLSTCRSRLPSLYTVTPLHASLYARRYTWRISSSVALWGKLTVLDTALSVNSWNAACILICHSGEMSWDVTNTFLTDSGISLIFCMDPDFAIWFMSSRL